MGDPPYFNRKEVNTMKKLISLLLVLALSLGLLTGIAMADDIAKPDEVTQADAGVKVTDGNGESYYFDTLSGAVTAWVMQAIPGPKTILVLKDLELDDSTGISSTRYLDIQGTQARWYGNNGHKHPMTIDLGGKTVKYTGEANFFFVERYGLTVKNGTLIHEGTGSKYRGIITVGTSKGATANSSATSLWAPEINLDGVTLVTTSPKGAHVITNYVHGTKFEIKDSTIWSTTKGYALSLNATDQSDMGDRTAYAGDFVASVEVENSTLGSSENYAVTCDNATYDFTIQDSLLVSNKDDGKMANDDTAAMFDTKGQDIVGPEEWAGEVAGVGVAGNSFAIGDAPGTAPVELPFTDVKEGDWFYEFVSEMYGKKIIAGMTETTFVPNGTLTYGQALKLIAVGLGKGEQPAGTHWASGYLDLAKKEGWLANDVDLNGSVTRVAFCQIAAAAKGLTEVGENPFKDTTDLSVLALVKAGVISGMSADTFAPDQTLTRAQIAKIISLLIKL